MIKTAKEAKLLAKMNGDRKVKRLYLQYMETIQQFASDGKYVLIVHGPFTCHEKTALELLKENGFVVSRHSYVYDDICCEDGYCKISWEQHKSPWQRIKERFC